MIETIAFSEIRTTDSILDVRRHAEMDQIRGAVRYDPAALLHAESMNALPLNKEERIVLQGDKGDVERIGKRLLDAGAADVKRLDGDVDAWRESGRAVEDVTQEQPVP